VAAVEHPATGLNIRKVEHGSLTWVDLTNPGPAETEYLRQNYHFHELALEDCLTPLQLPKLDDYTDYLFLVLHFPRSPGETRMTRPVEVDFFISGDYVITVHSGELRPLTKLFSDCESSQEVRSDVMGHSSGYLLYRILSGLVEHMFPVLTNLITSVDDLEAGIFDRGSAEALTRRLSILRRDILSYRRITRPEIVVLELLEAGDYPFLKVDPDAYFGDLADSLRRISAELDDLRAVVEGLSDAHQSLTSQHTTEVIRVLTVIFTITLPLSLIATLYGMNVRLPLADTPKAFWIVIGIVGLTTGGMLALFRLRRWF
jgi:magnesium transporter